MDRPSPNPRKLLLNSVVVVMCGIVLNAGCYTLFPISAVKVSQPSGKGKVVFIVDGRSVLYNEISFYVQDYERRPKFLQRPVLVGGIYARDGSSIEDAVWSQDGSVISTRGIVRGSGMGKSGYVDAYDFQEHQIVAELISEDEAKSLAIAKLIKQRGGLSKDIIPYPGSGGQKKSHGGRRFSIPIHSLAGGYNYLRRESAWCASWSPLHHADLLDYTLLLLEGT